MFTPVDRGIRLAFILRCNGWNCVGQVSLRSLVSILLDVGGETIKEVIVKV